MLCGDPRAWTKFRNRSSIPVTVRVAYTTGNKSKPAARKVVKRKLGVGRATIIGQQWVRGPYKAQVLDPEKKAWQTVFKYKVGKNVKPRDWKQGGCPADRFGTPSFGRPMDRGFYRTSITLP